MLRLFCVPILRRAPQDCGLLTRKSSCTLWSIQGLSWPQASRETGRVCTGELLSKLIAGRVSSGVKKMVKIFLNYIDPPPPPPPPPPPSYKKRWNGEAKLMSNFLWTGCWRRLGEERWGGGGGGGGNGGSVQLRKFFDRIHLSKEGLGEIQWYRMHLIGGVAWGGCIGWFFFVWHVNNRREGVCIVCYTECTK